MDDCFVSLSDANALIFSTMVFGLMCLFLFIKNRDDRWSRLSQKGSPLIKLEQITHPEMEISGYGDYYVMYIDDRYGKNINHKVYCLSPRQQREIAEMAKYNGRKNVELGARGVNEWENWKIPQRN